MSPSKRPITRSSSGCECFAANCVTYKNAESRSRGITFHKFPSKDKSPERYDRWHKNCKRKEAPTKWSMLCSSHFTEECMDRTGQIVRLRHGAVPNFFNSSENIQGSKWLMAENINSLCLRKQLSKTTVSLLLSRPAIQARSLMTSKKGSPDGDLTTMSDLTGDDSKTNNMNLDTLLEAAKFLEQRSEGPATSLKTRGEARNFHAYSKSPNEKDNDSSPEKSQNGSSSEEGKRRPGGAGTREVHNKLEKNRRAHLKECFDSLKKQIPSLQDKKTSNLSILRCSLRYVQMLKRKEKEFEQELQRLAQEKIHSQERIAILRKDLNQMNVDFDINNFMKSVDNDSGSDTTDTAENESPIVSDDEFGSTNNNENAKNKKTTNHANGLVAQALKHQGKVSTSTKLAIPKAGAATTTSLSITATSTARSITSSKPVTAALLTAPTAAGPIPVTQPTTSASNTFKTPVTQLLQQTLAHRALQQKLQQQHQQQLQNGTVITLTPNGLRHVTAQAIRPMTTVRGQTVTLNQLVPGLVQGASLSATPANLTTPVTLVSQSGNYLNLANFPKVLATTTLPSTTAAANTTPTSQSSATSSMLTLKLQSPIQAHLVNAATAAQLSSLGQLVAQVPPKPAVSMANMSASSMQPTLTPLTQILSPMTVMAPAGQVNQSLNNVVNSSVIKSLGHIPLLQQPFNLSQALVKPMVVMAPNGVVTTSASTNQPVQLQVSVTQQNS